MALWLALLSPLALGGEVGRDAPGTVRPVRHWDHQHMDLAVTLDPAGTLQGTVTHRVAPLGAPERWLTLHQVGLAIQAVTVDGKAVDSWRLTDDSVEIPMPGSSAAERTVTVSWTATPQRGLHFRQPDRARQTVAHAWSQGQGEDHRYWFPLWDHPTDRLTWTVAATVPTDWSVFSNGVQVEDAPAGGQHTVTWRHDQPTAAYLLALAAGPFDRHEHAARVPLEVWTLPEVDRSTTEHLLEVTGDQLSFFEDLLGTPYPYPAYRQAIVQHFLYSGMENASATILGDHLLPDAPGAPSRSLDAVGAHELAHQWFGDLLTCYGWRELWLNEGFATYYAHRWAEDRQGRDEVAPGVLDRRDGAARTQAPMAARAWSKQGDRDNANVYGRGATVLRYLEHLLGRAVFDAGIQHYVATHQGRLVESEDLRRALEDISGQDLGWVFDQWVTGGGAPTLETRWRHRNDQLTVTLSRGDDGPVFYGAVDVEIGTAKGERRVRAWLSESGGSVTLPLHEPPLWVAVDPDGAFPALFEPQQSQAAWRHQARRSPSPEARIAAVRALAEAGKDDETDTLLGVLLRDGSQPLALRLETAAALGTRASTHADEALLATVDSSEPRLRIAVLEALGGLPPLDATRRKARLTAARRALDSAEPRIAAAALTAVHALDEEQGRALARRWLSGPDTTPTRVRHTTAATVLGSSDESADLALLLRQAGEHHRRWPRQAALQSAVAVAERHGDLAPGDARALQRALFALATDEDQRPWSLAIGLLAEVGDAEAAVWLEELAANTLQPGVREGARDAAAQIRVRTATPVDEQRQHTDLQRLSERLDALRRQVEELEARP